jgi:hypothetical protein
MNYRNLYEAIMKLGKSERNVIISSLSEISLKGLFGLMKKNNTKPLNEILNTDEKITKKRAGKKDSKSVMWAAKRLALRNEYKNCEKLPSSKVSRCKENVTKQIRALAKETKKKVSR